MQWEYAALGGNYTDGGLQGLTLANVAWYKSNAGTHPMEVGQKVPNAYGLYDMLGNIREMCVDWYAELDSSVSQTLVDYSGPDTGTNRSSRGRYFNASGTGLTCYGRDGTMKSNQGTQYEGARVWALER